MRFPAYPILLALAAFAPAEVTITGAVPTDAAGNRIAPRLGEPFCLTVSLKVTKGTAPYRVAVDSPSATLDSGTVDFGIDKPGDYWIRRGSIVPLCDRAMDVTVTCSAAKKPFKLTIVPASANGAIETFARQRLSGDVTASVVLDRETSRLLAWLPLPEDGGYQSVLSVGAPVRQGLSRETMQPIGLVEAKGVDRIAVQASFATAAKSVRTNLALLRAVPMSAVTGREWLLPEARIQSDHKEIVAFARTATKGLSSKTPVADVALAIYSAVLKRSVYARTGVAPDALATLRNGKGECGDLSALFVAACRAAGVPARPVVGMSLGSSAWHVWAEFSVPGLGWVPVDPAYALGLRPHSSIPLYFGVVPELRDRVALGHAFSATLGEQSTTFLQTAQVFTFESGLGIVSASFACDLKAG